MEEYEVRTEIHVNHRDKLAAALTDLFELRRILTRNRLGYPDEILKPRYFSAPITVDKITPPVSVAVRQSRVKQFILSACGDNPRLMKGLIGTARRLRGTVTAIELMAGYLRSKDRVKIKIKLKDVLTTEFPEVVSLIKSRHVLYRAMRVGKVPPLRASATPYNLQSFRARDTSTLYAYDLLSDVSLSDGFYRMLDLMMEHAAFHGRFKTCLVLNFYAGGGAENAGLSYLNYYADQLGGSVLFILTDPGLRKVLPALPENIFYFDIYNFMGTQTFERRQSILLNTLLALRPSLLHLINSGAAWALLQQMPNSFIPDMKIISSNFALQFTDPRRKNVVGYAAANLPSCIAKLDAVVTDNRCFAVEGIETLGLHSYQDKLHVVYNPCSLDKVISPEDAKQRLMNRLQHMSQSSRIKVVWAGRLDEEKRIDILVEAAKLCQHFCDFHVYGSSVVSTEFRDIETLRKQKNVILEGAFSSPLEWESSNIKHVFFFTSMWEGMPNVLVEAAYLGMPVCAMNVGGVKELIREDTGWLLEEKGTAADLLSALESISADHGEVERRVHNLIHLVMQRHSRRSYADQMQCMLNRISILPSEVNDVSNHH